MPRGITPPHSAISHIPTNHEGLPPTAGGGEAPAHGGGRGLPGLQPGGCFDSSAAHETPFWDGGRPGFSPANSDLRNPALAYGRDWRAEARPTSLIPGGPQCRSDFDPGTNPAPLRGLTNRYRHP